MEHEGEAVPLGFGGGVAGPVPLFALGLLAYTQPMEAQVYDLSFVWEGGDASGGLGLFR